MSDGLKRKSYRGALWSGMDALGSRAMQFIVSVILARLLLPAQFGLIGMLAIFTAIAHALLNSGFASALIQKDEVTDADTSSVFYFNIVMSAGLAAVFFAAAPWIARFYRQPLLIPLARAMSLIFVADAFSVVPGAMLSRKLDFRSQTKVSIASVVCSGTLAVGLAVRGFGVWSLVALQVSHAFFRALLLWFTGCWRPSATFSVHALRNMFRFGSRLLASALLDQTFRNLFYVVIGRLYAPALLGFYTRARHMEELPSGALTNVVSRVSFPAFSSIQNDNARLTRGLRKALQLAVLWNAPLIIGLAVVAEPLVVVLLTETWLPTVPYLQLLCIAALTLPLHSLNLTILSAKGRSDLFLRLELVKKLLVAVGILIAWRWGVAALIISEIVVSIVAFFINSYFTRKFLGYGPLRQLSDVAVYFLFGAIMGAGVYAMRTLPVASDATLLLLQVSAGITVYTLLCATFRPSAFDEAWLHIRNTLSRVRA